eukprot:402639-Pyramimonas_sp.AAC.1
MPYNSAPCRPDVPVDLNSSSLEVGRQGVGPRINLGTSRSGRWAAEAPVEAAGNTEALELSKPASTVSNIFGSGGERVPGPT